MNEHAPRRVVIVDGNDDAAESLALSVSMAGHAALVLRSTHHALELIVRSRPDVVFTELALPGPHDGYALCRLLRRHPALADTTIVALAASAAPAGRTRMKEAGAHYFFAKPIAPRELSPLVATSSVLAWVDAEARLRVA